MKSIFLCVVGVITVFRDVDAGVDYRCTLPVYTEDLGNGPYCMAHIPSYTYDSSRNECVPFIYGGCGGNANHFVNKAICEKTCKNRHNNVPKVVHGGNGINAGVDYRCTLPVYKQEIGKFYCTAYIPSYTYDSSRNKCVRFIYGGCGGNANHFDDKAICKKTCKNRHNNVPKEVHDASVDYRCTLPVYTEDLGDGPYCMAHIPSYTYDSSRNKCVPFIYGGCGGNANHFDNKAICEETCKNRIYPHQQWS